MLSTAAAMLLYLAIWWIVLTLLIHDQFILPANTAAADAERLISQLSAGSPLDTASIPSTLRWVLVENGQIRSRSAMSERHLGWIKDYLTEGSRPHGFPYTQYYRHVQLDQHRLFLIQFDYATPYVNPHRQQTWPDFQICYLLILLLCEGLIAALSTRRSVRALKKEIATLNKAVQAVSRQEISHPFSDVCAVREFNSTLEAMDTLRQTLSDSLHSQWTLEHRRIDEQSLLAHNLRTPLSVIIGQTELLQEELCPDDAAHPAAIILREAESIRQQIDALCQPSDPSVCASPAQQNAKEDRPF